MIVQACIFLFSCLLLAVGSDRLVATGLFLSRYYRWDPRVVAILLMGFATSFPELIVSSTAALQGSVDIAVGNAVGSNIVNIGLVLALFMLCRPIVFTAKAVVYELCLLSVLSAVLLFICYQGQLTPGVAVGLVAFFVLYVGVLCYSQAGAVESDSIPPLSGSRGTAMVWGVFGLVAIFLASHYLIQSATMLSIAWGVDQRLMGVVWVALGTSLPELSVTLASLLRGASGFAIGNVVGSNLFNSLVVFSAPAVLTGRGVAVGHFVRDGWVMFGMTAFLLCVLLCQFRAPAYRMGRLTGLLLLLAWCGYQYSLL